MTPSLTDILCTQCGLCCDGSLFAEVELAGRAETTKLEILGLEIDDEDADHEFLRLPCAGLDGRRCSIYVHRPETCRTFECRLLQDVRHGRVDVGRATATIKETLEQITYVRELMKRLGRRQTRQPLAEACADAVSAATVSTPGIGRALAELEAAVAMVEERIRTRFLGGPRAARSRSRPDAARRVQRRDPRPTARSAVAALSKQTR